MAYNGRIKTEEMTMTDPRMPEVPSEEVIALVVGASTAPGMQLVVRGFYDAIRKALQQQERQESP